MFNKTLFQFAYYLKRPTVLKRYYEFAENNNISRDELEKQQYIALKNLVNFCHSYVPYYKRLFDDLGFTSQDILSIKDLEKLPILTKSQIKNNPDSFMPKKYKVNYVNGSTGGSTGIPLKYRMSDECYCRGVALLFRGLGLAGYNPGDKMCVIAGASLVSTKKPIIQKVRDYLSNVRHYSSYGMTNNELRNYVVNLNKWKPSYLRGYASSLYMLAKFIQENDINLTFQLKAVFSTAEVLQQSIRKTLEIVFRTKVFDNYGLNDGGVSAFECNQHNGMHIDSERSVLEVINKGEIIDSESVGSIVATSLYNYAMPFIRYDTGDLGQIEQGFCSCGIQRPLLKKVYGRTTDYLKLNNKLIGSPVLTVLMGKIDIERYQIVQLNTNELNIHYMNKEIISDKDKQFIVSSICNHVGTVKFNFKKVDANAFKTKNKHKFIVNEVCL